MTDAAKMNRISMDRSAVRGQVTKLHAEVKGDISLWDKNQFLQRKMKLNDLNPRLTKLDNDYMELLSFTADIQSTYQLEFERNESYKEKIYEIYTILDQHIAESPSPVHNQSHVNSFKLKAPKVPLPRFTDKEGGLSLNKFFTEFEIIVNKLGCSEWEKFLLLQENVEGRALKLVDYLSVRDRSYTKAKEVLMQALANPLIQKFEVIERAIKLSTSKSKDAINFITEFKLIVDEFKAQKIDINSILQYCILSGMDEQLKSSLIQITNSNFPTLEQIDDKIFLALERYNLQQNSSFNEPHLKSKIKTDSLAANIPEKSIKTDKDVSNKSNRCSLCIKSNRTSDHAIFKCPNYPSAENKLNFIRDNNGCLKCGYFSHSTDKCKFSFKYTCRYCPENHFSFLCPENDSESEKLTTNATSVSFPNISVLLSQSGSQTFLPTITVETNEGNHIRVLKDSGSEFTFLP